jgi:hypothetical protein
MFSHSVCVNGETSCSDTTKLFMFSPKYLMTALLERIAAFPVKMIEYLSRSEGADSGAWPSAYATNVLLREHETII